MSVKVTVNNFFINKIKKYEIFKGNSTYIYTNNFTQREALQPSYNLSTQKLRHPNPDYSITLLLKT